MKVFSRALRRSSRIRNLVWGLTIVLAAILPTGSAQALAKADSAIVRPDPLVAVVYVGGQVVVNLYVQDVVNLYGADIRISFDPAVLQVVDADPSVLGVQIQPLSSFLIPDFVVRKKACNAVDPTDPDCQVGGVVWYAVTQLNPSTPVSGSGPLAAVTFKRLQPGTTVLKVTHNQLADRFGALIPSSSQNGVVELPVATHKVYLPLLLR
jgi:hypothetical protein